MNFGRVQSSWSGTGDPLDLLRVWSGLPGHCPSLSNLLFSIPLANFRLNANWDSAGNLLARAQEFNALTSETEQRKVNWKVRPSFGILKILQTNRIMPYGIDIIHPMFWVVVEGDGLGIIKGLPLPCDSPVCLVKWNFIYETMSTHNLSHVPIVLVTMHKEIISVKNPPEGFGTAKLLVCKVCINSFTGDVLWPVPSLLN